MKRVDTINVIPMIDIMLVMLAIVLTTATFIKFGQLEVDLPQAKSATNSVQQHSNSIVIDKQGDIFLNEELLGLAQLDLELSRIDVQESIALRVDQAASFGDFTAVVDLLKSHQMHRVSIIVQPAD